MNDRTMSDGTRLGEQLRRERLLDMEERLRPYRRRAFAVLAIALIAGGPWIGWQWIPLLAGAALGYPVADRGMSRSARPELWAGGAWAWSCLVIAGGIALTGGPDSPAVAWLALTSVTLGARFERRGVIAGLVWISVLMVTSTVAVDPAAAGDEPQYVIAALALVLAVTLLSGAVIQSDREHRRGAVIDPLTGLFNRAALAQRFAELEHQARQTPDTATVGFLVGDLDHFKKINDEHGHVVGDAVLQNAAYAMRNALRAFDLVYRIGGEEFVVVLPGASMNKSEEIAERLRMAVAASAPRGIPVSISFGVASGTPGDLGFGVLYERADGALYEAKENGRNQVVVAA